MKIPTVGSFKPVVASFLTIAAYTCINNLITTHCGTDLGYRITAYITDYHLKCWHASSTHHKYNAILRGKD